MHTNENNRQTISLRGSGSTLSWFFLVAVLAITTCRADTVTWNGSVDTDWFEGGNWTPAQVPVDGDDVVINATAAPATNVVLSADTAALASLTITDSMLVFTNWTTTLNATNVTIGSGGVFTLPPAFADGAMSNRVHVVCSALSILPGGVIDVDGKGFDENNGPQPGLSGSDNAFGGGGHGGVGGLGTWTTGGRAGGVYDMISAPVAAGSGGGGGGPLDEFGGAGGGAVRIEAPGGTVRINGLITANGIDATAALDGGGGAGGAIFINCETFTDSSNGILRANGGNAAVGGGGGGGGRIAVLYTTLANSDGVQFSTSAGTSMYTGDNWYLAAAMGTVYLSDATLLSETLTDNLFTGVRLQIPGFTSWSVSALTVSNCSVEFAENGFQLTISGGLTIGANGALGVGAESGTTNVGLSCSSITLNDGGSLSIYSGPANMTTDYGALVNVSGDIIVNADSWIYPYSHSSNGGSPLFRMQNLSISSDGGFNALGRGYATSKGTGSGGPASARSAGGGYGGIGGASAFGPGGITYGSAEAPIDAGSGAATYNYAGGRGGGVIRIEANGNVTMNGSLNAKGGGPNRGGGGAGGSIFLRCNVLSGTGTLNADGGKQAATVHGDGGGGRIALVVVSDRLSGEAAGAYEGYAGSANGRVTVNAGTGGNYEPYAENGSFYLKVRQGTFISIR